MPSASELNYPSRVGYPVSEPRYLLWLRQLGWRFPLFAIFGFLAISGLLALPARIALARWEMVAIAALAPAILLILVIGLHQALRGIRALSHNLAWWHGPWLLIFVSSLVFRIRDAADAQSLPIDGYAMLRLMPEAIVGLLLLGRFLRAGSSLRRSSLQGLAGALSIYSLVCLTSAIWSVQGSWTVYKSAEYLLDVTVLAAVLATDASTETYESFFNWTLILYGVELLWTWMGAVIWPAEALYSGGRLMGVFPIQSANAIGASGAILSVVAFCRLLPLPGCRYGRSWNILLFGFGVASMIACKTRTALGGFLIGIFLVLIFSRRARIVAVASSVLLLATYTVALAFSAAPQPDALWNRVASPSGAVLSFLQRGQSQRDLESLTGRTEWWQFAWQQFMEHPWTGLGAYAGGKFAVLSKMGFGDTSQLHSDYLETLVGTSIWGLIPLLAALFGTWWLLVRFVRTPSLQPFERQLALEAIGILGVITVRSFVNVEIIWHAPQFFLLVLGYAELLRRRARLGHPLPTRTISDQRSFSVPTTRHF
jgi:O-antigen ligase